MKRPDKIKLAVVKPPSGLIFHEHLFRRDSVYVAKIQEALAADSVIEILDADKYLQHQFKKAAEKAKVRLVYARAGEKLYIKPITQSDQEKRLVLLLREPRTMNDLMGAKLELDLQSTLARMEKAGTAHTMPNGIAKGKWVLTEAGMDLLG